MWKFKHIVDHEGPLNDSHTKYKGYIYNVVVEWKTGETNTNTLSIIVADDPVTCDIYTYEKNLLQQEG